MIAVVTALREELSPLLKRARVDRVVRVGKCRCHVGTLMGKPIVMMAGGDGLTNAEESVSQLLQRFDVALLIGMGIAGGVDPSLRFGDIVVSGEAPIAGRRATIASVERIARDKSGIDAQVVDTESAGWARAARKFGVPYAVVRAVFDPIDEKIPDFVSTDRVAVVRHALTHPKAIPVLMDLRERVRKCAEALADFVIASAIAPEARLEELLRETSRTFALCIPLLPGTTRQQVTIAYLLFRIADTFEDASHWPVADRLAALDAFCSLLRKTDSADAQRLAREWCAKGPSRHAGYLKLIADVPLVVDAFTKLQPAAVEVIREHVIRSAQGMAKFVAMTGNGSLQLADIDQLRAYCYAVAGIVGEMLTELFLLRAPQLRGAAALLRSRAATFGEGLQLVNILKDSLSDASEGRTYIPPGAERATIIELARNDLEVATEYTLALQSSGAPNGITAFAALPVALAEATLDKLETSTATKIARPTVFRITRQVNRSVARGEPPLRLRSQSQSGFERMRSIFSTTR
jgi:farnesyl-diphosphate farnesyltransferase